MKESFQNKKTLDSSPKPSYHSSSSLCLVVQVHESRPMSYSVPKILLIVLIQVIVASIHAFRLGQVFNGQARSSSLCAPAECWTDNACVSAGSWESVLATANGVSESSASVTSHPEPLCMRWSSPSIGDGTSTGSTRTPSRNWAGETTRDASGKASTGRR